ncbi:uncharacterized protein NEMAJ01_1292 [Nematocida major]|uniref:uncharacterized protein n=1 Tax=Nematocida major TaxID=1912982 RepID=UPI002008D4B0|nr:uncharacterized protein NEMAJ01_1292 [Nematocida major]KAH9386396.1 hypothetical protein NEMAJ01_1292 [Nematocida major]
MNSLPTNDTRGSQFLKRMAVKHIKQIEMSNELKQNALFRGMEVSMVEAMGWVQSVKEISNNGKKFVLADGTDTISCLVWGEKREISLNKGDFVKVLGSIGRYDQKDDGITFTCASIARVSDGNNAVYHLLMRIVDSLRAEKARDPDAAGHRENIPVKRQDSMRHIGDFNEIHMDILSYFSNNQGETGLPVNMVTSSLVSSGKYSKKEIEGGLDYLIDAGKLFYCAEDRKTLALVE